MNDQTSESDVALLSLRDRIDEIDARIQALISERATVAREVGVAKGFMITSDFYRPEREAHVLREVVRRNNGPLGDDEMVRVFREIMSACLAQEEPLKVAFLGPKARSRSRRFSSSSVTRYGHCRWAPSPKYFTKLKAGSPTSAWFQWRTPPRVRLPIRLTCSSVRH